MQLDQAYQFKNPPCIHEVVDDEVIIINMEKGHYYNVKGVAKKVFVDLIAGIRPSELSKFNRWDKETEEKLGQFVEALIEENIIEIKKNKSTDLNLNMTSIAITNLDEDMVLHTYTDMEEILGLDPIHEIDQKEGWPHVSQ